MFSGKTEHPQKSNLQIKLDNKFFGRLLSKESSMTHPSFRVAVAVPFVWESQPGTPKYALSEDTLPPLTPPPSYFFNTSVKKPVRKSSRSNFVLTLFPKLNLKKYLLSHSPSSLSTTSSISSLPDSSKVIPSAKMRRRRFSSSVSSFDFPGYEEEEDVDSPNSTLCFGIRSKPSSKSDIGSCCK